MTDVPTQQRAERTPQRVGERNPALYLSPGCRQMPLPVAWALAW